MSSFRRLQQLAAAGREAAIHWGAGARLPVLKTSMHCICTHSPEAHDENGCRLCPCFKYGPMVADANDEYETEASAKLMLHRMQIASPQVQ